MIGWNGKNASANNACDYHRNSNSNARHEFPLIEQENNYNVTDSQLTSNALFLALKAEMEKTRRSMERLEGALVDKNNCKLEDVMWEWRAVSIVIDRFFFALYVVLIGLSLMFFFPRYPFFIKKFPTNAQENPE